MSKRHTYITFSLLNIDESTGHFVSKNNFFSTAQCRPPPTPRSSLVSGEYTSCWNLFGVIWIDTFKQLKQQLCAAVDMDVDDTFVYRRPVDDSQWVNWNSGPIYFLVESLNFLYIIYYLRLLSLQYISYISLFISSSCGVWHGVL